MDETAMFLQAARVGGEAHKRVGDRTMAVDVGDWLRLVEMADRWSIHKALCLQAQAAEALRSQPLPRMPPEWDGG